MEPDTLVEDSGQLCFNPNGADCFAGRLLPIGWGKGLEVRRAAEDATKVVVVVLLATIFTRLATDTLDDIKVLLGDIEEELTGEIDIFVGDFGGTGLVVVVGPPQPGGCFVSLSL